MIADSESEEEITISEINDTEEIQEERKVLNEENPLEFSIEPDDEIDYEVLEQSNDGSFFNLPRRDEIAIEGSEEDNKKESVKNFTFSRTEESRAKNIFLFRIVSNIVIFILTPFGFGVWGIIEMSFANKASLSNYGLSCSIKTVDITFYFITNLHFVGVLMVTLDTIMTSTLFLMRKQKSHPSYQRTRCIWCTGSLLLFSVLYIGIAFSSLLAFLEHRSCDAEGLTGHDKRMYEEYSLLVHISPVYGIVAVIFHFLNVIIKIRQ